MLIDEFSIEGLESYQCNANAKQQNTQPVVVLVVTYSQSTINQLQLSLLKEVSAKTSQRISRKVFHC